MDKILLTNIQTYSKLAEFIESHGEYLVYIYSGEKKDYWRDKRRQRPTPFTLKEAWEKCKKFKPYKQIEFHLLTKFTAYIFKQSRDKPLPVAERGYRVWLYLDRELLSREFGWVTKIELYSHQVETGSYGYGYLYEDISCEWQKVEEVAETEEVK